jgi:hypothetical protein
MLSCCAGAVVATSEDYKRIIADLRCKVAELEAQIADAPRAAEDPVAEAERDVARDALQRLAKSITPVLDSHKGNEFMWPAAQADLRGARSSLRAAKVVLVECGRSVEP